MCLGSKSLMFISCPTVEKASHVANKSMKDLVGSGYLVEHRSWAFEFDWGDVFLALSSSGIRHLLLPSVAAYFGSIAFVLSLTFSG